MTFSHYQTSDVDHWLKYRFIIFAPLPLLRQCSTTGLYNTVTTILSYRNVSKSYRDGGFDLSVLFELSFEVPQATLFALSGRSGSGKSTILNLAAGFDDVDNGEITFGEQIVSSAPKTLQEKLRRTDIGFVFQRTHLLPELNALENITLSMHDPSMSSQMKRDVAMELLADFNLGDRAKHRPEQLSGGQRQRVAVARAIAGNKKLLLADEPTSSLDDDNRDHMIAIFRGLIEKRGLTIVMSSHDTHMLTAADHVLSLDQHA